MTWMTLRAVPEFQEKFEIEGEYNLVILNPVMADGGAYLCRDTLPAPNQALADLIIIGAYT